MRKGCAGPEQSVLQPNQNTALLSPVSRPCLVRTRVTPSRWVPDPVPCTSPSQGEGPALPRSARALSCGQRWAEAGKKSQRTPEDAIGSVSHGLLCRILYHRSLFKIFFLFFFFF